jgi:hypothetical protein
MVNHACGWLMLQVLNNTKGQKKEPDQTKSSQGSQDKRKRWFKLILGWHANGQRITNYPENPRYYNNIKPAVKDTPKAMPIMPKRLNEREVRSALYSTEIFN